MASRKVCSILPRSVHHNFNFLKNSVRYLSKYDAKSSNIALDHEKNSNTLLETEAAVDPLQHEDFFGVRQLVSMRELFDARVHLGHKPGTRNSSMRPFIFGSRLGIDIIDLNQTIPLLHEALNFAAHIAYREGIILFLSRHIQTLPIVERVATDTGEYAHCRKWQPGTFTNSINVYNALTRLPDLCIFLNTHDTVFEQHLAVKETAKCNIPTIGILDTSSDARLITYPVPGNDDTPCAVNLYCKLFKEAILLGKNKRKELERQVDDL